MRWITPLGALGLTLLAACSPAEGQRVPDGGLGGTGHSPAEICTDRTDCPEEIVQNVQRPEGQNAAMRVG